MNDTSTSVDTPARDLSTVHNVIEFLTEILDSDNHPLDFASTYGEPGYSTPTGATTPLVVLGYYWCRCDKIGEPYGDGSYLHDIAAHYPTEFELLAEQGVEFEWYDEWVLIYDEDACYRTTGDSYSWKPSVIMGDYDWMTPADDDSVWIEWATNEDTRCIPDHVLDTPMSERDDWQRWNGGFANGWYPGQSDDPKAISQKIRSHCAQYRDTENVEIVYVLDRTGQFDIGFSAYYRTPDTEEDE